MAREFKGNQQQFNPYWERARVIDRLRHIFARNFSETVIRDVPGGGVLRVLAGAVMPPIGEGPASSYRGGVRIARLEISSKDLCEVRTLSGSGWGTITGLYDLRTTAENLWESTIPPEETETDELFNHILERPMFFRGVGAFSLNNIVAQPTNQLASDMAWYLTSHSYEAQFAPATQN